MDAGSSSGAKLKGEVEAKMAPIIGGHFRK